MLIMMKDIINIVIKAIGIFMNKNKDYVGKKFERFLVIKRGKNTNDNRSQWWCLCDCQKDLQKEDQKLTLLSIRQLKTIAKNNNGYFYCKSCPKNKYDLTGEYGIGYTEKGEEFYFDLEDYDKIKKYRWYIENNKYKYVVTNATIDNHKRKLALHRVVMNINDPNIDIDHIKHKGYDNRKSQLRVCNAILNERNRVLNKNNTSGEKGVWKKKSNKWVAEIWVNKKKITIGTYNTKEEATKARKEAEEKYFGEWSYDNSQKHGINEN